MRVLYEFHGFWTASCENCHFNSYTSTCTCIYNRQVQDLIILYSRYMYVTSCSSAHLYITKKIKVTKKFTVSSLYIENVTHFSLHA